MFKGTFGAALFLILCVIAAIWIYLKWGYMLPAPTTSAGAIMGGGNKALPGVNLVDKFRQAAGSFQTPGLTGTVLTSRKAI